MPTALRLPDTPNAPRSASRRWPNGLSIGMPFGSAAGTSVGGIPGGIRTGLVTANRVIAATAGASFKRSAAGY